MKDTYYFQHDYNPTADPKMQALIGEFGAIGYGIYWRLVEMMHEAENHKIEHKKYVITAIAKQMLTSVEQVSFIIENCINEYELFESDGEFFWSERVLRNINKRTEISEKRSIAGKISSERRKQNSTSVEQVLTSVQQNPTKESKGKESKKNKSIEKEINIEDVKTYFNENGYTEESAIKFFNYYSIAEWKDSKGNKVKSWKQKAQAVWFKDEYKIIKNNIANLPPSKSLTVEQYKELMSR